MKVLDAYNVLWYSPFATLPETELKNLRGEMLKLPNIHRVITSDKALSMPDSRAEKRAVSDPARRLPWSVSGTPPTRAP